MRLTRECVSYAFDPDATPVATIEPGSTAVFETHDARGGALADRAEGSLYELPLPTPGRSNPLTGPVAIAGAEPGDSLVVTVEDIALAATGWCGGHAHIGPFEPGRIPTALARTCPVRDGAVSFSEEIAVKSTPMVGCLGTAPASAVPSSAAGRYGGNLDQRPVAPGSRVHLPVAVHGGLLYAGDVHASQGDGELSGLGLEIAAEITLTLDLAKGTNLCWPWVETKERLIVLTAGRTFEAARNAAVDAMLRTLETQLRLEPAEALGLLSLAGDLRVGQCYGADETTLRLEVPTSLGLVPQ